MRMINNVISAVTADVEFEWTSLQVNVNSVSNVHSDSNNIGLSLIFLLGHFGGGTVHMEDQSLTL